MLVASHKSGTIPGTGKVALFLELEKNLSVNVEIIS